MPQMRMMPPRQAPRGPFGVLSEEQLASYQKALAGKQEQYTELSAKLQAVNREVFDAMYSDKVDEKLIREKVQAAAAISADISLLRAQAFSEIQPPITPDELAKFKAAAMAPQQPQPQIIRREAPPAAGTNQPVSPVPAKP